MLIDPKRMNASLLASYIDIIADNPRRFTKEDRAALIHEAAERIQPKAVRDAETQALLATLGGATTGDSDEPLGPADAPLDESAQVSVSQ